MGSRKIQKLLYTVYTLIAVKATKTPQSKDSLELRTVRLPNGNLLLVILQLKIDHQNPKEQD